MRNSLQQPKSTSRSLVFDEALRLNQIGLSIISIGANKKPAISSWKKYQYEAAAEQVIRGWFSKNEDLGVGIVLGLPSQSLYARDFDTLDAYERWRLANPEHATRLPTVATARGKHVYGRWREVRTQKFADGELRGIGAYVVAPPSIHPTGFQYQWDIPLISLDDIPLIDPIEAGFVTTDEDATDRHRLDTVGSVRLVGSVLCEQSVYSGAADFQYSAFCSRPTSRLPVRVGKANPSSSKPRQRAAKELEAIGEKVASACSTCDSNKVL
jgi:hypothetical protein